MTLLTLVVVAALLLIVLAFALFLRAIDRDIRPVAALATTSEADERRMLVLVASASDIGLPFAPECKGGREFGPAAAAALTALAAKRLVYAVRDDETQDGYCLTTAGERLVETFPERHPAFESKYGLLSSSRKAFHPGEPVFVLRATDPIAPDAVKAYALRCHLADCSPLHVEDVRAVAERMRRWQQQNPELVKQRPD